jgi:CHAD domain-containing protein
MARPGLVSIGRNTLSRWQAARRRTLDSHGDHAAVHELRTSTRRLLALELLLAPAGARRRLAKRIDDAFHAAGRLRNAQLSSRELRQLSAVVPPAARLARHEEHRLPRLALRLQRELQEVHPAAITRNVEQWLQPARGNAETVLATRARRRLQAQLPWISAPAQWHASAHALHLRRIHLKQLRYMAELAQAAGLALPRHLSLRQLAALQERLGAVTDVDMELRVVARFSRRHPHWRDDARALRAELLQRRAAALHRLQARRGRRSIAPP